MTRDEDEALLKKEKEKDFASTLGLDLKLLCPLDVTVKPYSVGYVVS